MLRSWHNCGSRKSNAHLLLLSRFLHPETADDFAKSDNWRAALGESPKQAIKRFTDEGMLIQADLDAQLDYRFKATELKAMLKQRGLPISGRKGDLISRLVQADPAGMKGAVANLLILLCSEPGRVIAEQYLSTEKAKRVRLEERVLQYLKQREFKEASLSIAAYEVEQVFPRGIGIDWGKYDPARDIERLKSIFGSKPKILSRLNDDHDDQLAALRLAAGMISLLGTSQGREWLPPDFDTGLAMDNDAAARMLSFYASHLASIASYRQSGVVKQLEILAAQDSCSPCKKISGRRYKLNEVLELPYEHCTNEMGCRCTLIPVVE